MVYHGILWYMMVYYRIFAFSAYTYQNTFVGQHFLHRPGKSALSALRLPISCNCETYRCDISAVRMTRVVHENGQARFTRHTLRHMDTRSRIHANVLDILRGSLQSR